jgi:hypothetical protein
MRDRGRIQPAPGRIVALILLSVVLLPATTRAEPPENDAAPTQDRLGWVSREVFGGLEELVDWEELWLTMSPSLVDVYEHNGWTSEPDAFSLELALDVAAIPPWQVERRVERFGELMSERYLLDEEQEGHLRDLAAREIDRVMRRHARDLMPIAAEALGTWAAGEPMTSEQVARWVTQSEPAFRDAQKGMEAATRDFLKVLDEEQQAWVREDLAAANKRFARVAEMRAAARSGDFDPAEWGLSETGLFAEQPAPQPEWQPDDDTAAAPPDRPPPRPQRDRVPPRATSRPADGDAWARYVRAYIRAYELDAAQKGQAWRICRRLQAQRDFYAERGAARLARLRDAQAGTSKQSERIATVQEECTTLRRRLFAALKSRLDRILTRDQRRTGTAPPDPTATD